MIIKSAVILTFLLSSISAFPNFMNSLVSCMLKECQFRVANSDYSKSLLKCSTNNSQCLNSLEGFLQDMCKVSTCLQQCDNYFNESDSACNYKCMEKNSFDIQKSCISEAKPAQGKADTHYLDKDNEEEESSDDILMTVVYSLIGLISGMVIAGFICCYLKKKQREKKQKQEQQNNNKAQTNKATTQQKSNISQEIALGYPALDNIFDDNNVYFVGDFQKIQSQPSIQGSQAFIKQNSILSTVTQQQSNQQILQQQSSLPDHLQKYIKNNIPIKNAVIGENLDDYNQLQFMIPQGTKL